MALYTTISCGPVFTMTQNTIYALPPGRILITVQAGGGTVNIASDDGGTFSVVTLTNQAFETSAAFAKATGANTIVSVEKL